MRTQLPPRKGAQRFPTFRPMSVVAKRSPMSVTAEVLFPVIDVPHNPRSGVLVWHNFYHYCSETSIVAWLYHGLPACQVSFWSIQPFGHNTPRSQTGQDRQTRKRSDSTRQTVLQTVTEKLNSSSVGSCHLRHGNAVTILVEREVMQNVRK